MGSECSNELLGRRLQEVEYSDRGGEKQWREGDGVVDEWGSEGGSPRIAERMEYSKLAPSEPKEKGAELRDVLNKGSFAVTASMTNR